MQNRNLTALNEKNSACDFFSHYWNFDAISCKKMREYREIAPENDPWGRLASSVRKDNTFVQGDNIFCAREIIHLFKKIAHLFKGDNTFVQGDNIFCAREIIHLFKEIAHLFKGDNTFVEVR